jgi:hypothetical protein
MLIDRTYFDGDLILTVSEPSQRAAVDAAIATYEDEFLRKLLGPSLYDAFIAGLASGTGTPFSSQFSNQFGTGTVAQRWQWIRDGHTYTYGGRSYTWPGLKNSKKQSPIANYTYWHYVKKNSRPTTQFGPSKGKVENATVVSPALELKDVWNEMVEWCQALGYMLIYLELSGAPAYPEFNWAEVDGDLFEHQNLFGL